MNPTRLVWQGPEKAAKSEENQGIAVMCVLRSHRRYAQRTGGADLGRAGVRVNIASQMKNVLDLYI